MQSSPDSTGTESSENASRVYALLANLFRERQRLQKRSQPKLGLILRLLHTLEPNDEMIPTMIRQVCELLQAAGMSVYCPQCNLPATLEFRFANSTGEKASPAVIVFHHAGRDCCHELTEQVPQMKLRTNL